MDDDARTLLNRIPALRRPCDLDLLLFFARHSRALLSGEQLARLLGYPLKEIARSRDVLLAAGFLMRTKDRARPEQMYKLAPNDTNGRSVPAILELASTRDGRLALMRALLAQPVGGSDNAAEASRDDTTRAARHEAVSGSTQTHDQDEQRRTAR
jgi:hypothetical protein